MSSDNLLKKIKELREVTGVGFKDCKIAIDETNGDIQKSVELLRKKGIAKANKRMGRVAAEGLVCVSEDSNKIAMVEINSETDFVAKNNEFIIFVEEISKLSLEKKGKIEDILISNMTNQKNAEENLVDLVSKIGEKITIRRNAFVDSTNCVNFSYVHSSLKKNVGKLAVILSLRSKKSKSELSNLGKQLSMHIAASAPISIDKGGLDKQVVEKEKEIIIEELKNSGKDNKIIEKIALGKLNKFINDNTLLEQEWIIDPKKKVKDIIKEFSGNEDLKIESFFRFKVGEGL